MLNVYTQPRKKKAMTPGAMFLSVVLHGGALVAAVYLTIQAPVEAKGEEELVEFVEIQDDEPPPPDEAPPPPPMEAPPPVVQNVLIPPVEIPTDIPAVDLTQLAVSATDFSGIGAAAVTTTTGPVIDLEAARQDSTFAFEVAVLDSPPSIANMTEVQRTLSRLYPRMLLNAGITGTVQVQFVIQPDGRVDPSSVRVVSASNDQFSNATVQAINEFRFRPGIYRGEPVRVLIEMPIQWQVGS
ncbi:MAG: TonB family protein [Gemmatimonadota bacterium]|jgi:protein TonB|nr:TonB family protein [Gemmatimonadota bacterium]